MPVCSPSSRGPVHNRRRRRRRAFLQPSGDVSSLLACVPAGLGQAPDVTPSPPTRPPPRPPRLAPCPAVAGLSGYLALRRPSAMFGCAAVPAYRHISRTSRVPVTGTPNRGHGRRGGRTGRWRRLSSPNWGGPARRADAPRSPPPQVRYDVTSRLCSLRRSRGGEQIISWDLQAQRRRRSRPDIQRRRPAAC